MISGWGISIDPGVSTGWAVWDSGRLMWGGVACAPSGASTDTQAATVAQGVPVGAYRWGAVEEMEYRPSDTKSNPKDLIKVAGIGGYIIGRMSGLPNFTLTMIPPTRWAGGTPQRIRDNRIRSVLKRRGDESTLIRILGEINKSKHEHFYDALGIGLFRLGLIRRGAISAGNKPYR